jgi:hypothetical protein
MERLVYELFRNPMPVHNLTYEMTIKVIIGKNSGTQISTGINSGNMLGLIKVEYWIDNPYIVIFILAKCVLIHVF